MAVSADDVVLIISDHAPVQFIEQHRTSNENFELPIDHQDMLSEEERIRLTYKLRYDLRAGLLNPIMRRACFDSLTVYSLEPRSKPWPRS